MFRTATLTIALAAAGVMPARPTAIETVRKGPTVKIYNQTSTPLMATVGRRTSMAQEFAKAGGDATIHLSSVEGIRSIILYAATKSGKIRKPEDVLGVDMFHSCGDEGQYPVYVTEEDGEFNISVGAFSKGDKPGPKEEGPN